MWEILYELIKSPLGLPINPFYEYLIFALVGELAFWVAWIISPGGPDGREIHWTVRIVTYISSWAIIRFTIWLYGIIVTYWFTIICVIIALIVGFVLGWLLARKRYYKKENTQNEKNEKQ